MGSGRRHAVPLGEESITDYLLLNLKRWHPTEISIRKFNKTTEEPLSGADWEWWLGGTPGGWVRMRIQAKRLHNGGTYPYLAHNNQSTRLIASARKVQAYPLYCFYNNWDLRMFHPPWNCGTQPYQPHLYGCAIADAQDVHAAIQLKHSSLQDIIDRCYPWSCLVCCRGGNRSAGGPWAQHIKNFLDRILMHGQNSGKTDYSPPGLFKNLPEDVARIFEMPSKGEGIAPPEAYARLGGIVKITNKD